MGLASLSIQEWQVPWDLPLLDSNNGKSPGTCHFIISKRASPMGLAIFSFNIGKSHGTCHFWTLIMASPMGLALWADVQDRKGNPFEYFLRIFSTNQKPGFQAVDQWEALILTRFLVFAEFLPSKNRNFEDGKSDGTCHFQSVSRQAELGSYGSGKSHGTCHFWILIMASPMGHDEYSNNGKSHGTWRVKMGTFAQKCPYSGTEKWHFGYSNGNSKTTFISLASPKNDGMAFDLKRLWLLNGL